MDLKQTKLEEKLKGVLATPKGKGVVAGLILIIVLLLVLLVVTFAIPQPDDSAGLLVNREIVKSLDKTTQMPVAQTPAQAVISGAVVNTATVEETESVKYSDEIMKFRDPFAPIIESTTTTGRRTVYTESSIGDQTTGATDSTDQNPDSGSGSGTSTGSTSVGSSGGSENSGGSSGDGSTATSGNGITANTIVLNAITTESGVRYGVFLYNGVQYVAKGGDVIGSSSYQVLDVGDGSATLLYGDDRITISLGEEIVK